ncbi:MAG TPA: NAD(P)/FAD-dependent oxidoreductase [Acidiferrobacter sp.]|nr:NAD(P)/FAD-dependent oxidoreductase [Acidiferrobacter sp.]
MTTTVCDVAVIGCGAGGYRAAITAAQSGALVVLIENERVGGSCLNYACVPKKALAHIATVLCQAQTFMGAGLKGQVSGDLPAAIAFKDKVVADLRRGLPMRLKQHAIEMIKGQARLLNPHQIHVDGPDGSRVIEARRIILATGAAPRALAEVPVDHEFIVDADSFIPSLSVAPAATVLCVGGGALGVEAAFLLQEFGSEATIVTRGPRLVDRPVVSDRAAALLERRLKEIGVVVRKGLSVRQARVVGAGVDVEFSDDSTARFDRVLVAVGREPRPDDLGLQALGLVCDARGFVVTNDYLETSVPGIFAIGDLKGGPMTAAAAMHDGRVAGENAACGNTRKRNYNQVPLVLDSVVPIAAVGLSEDMAEAAGFTPDVVYIPFGGSVKARAHNDSVGFIEIVYDEETGQMLGGCIAGAGADELVHLLVAACRSRRGLWSFTDLDYGHPSWGEDMGAALDPHLVKLLRSANTLFRPGIYAAAD